MTKKVILDIRSTHLAGIFRYSISILESFLKKFHSKPFVLYMVYRKDTDYIVKKIFKKYSKFLEDLVCFVPTEVDKNSFIPCSRVVQKIAEQGGIDLYYTTNYMLEKDISNLPFVFTIHDLIRLKFPEYSYTDEDFIKKFSFSSFQEIKKELLSFEQGYFFRKIKGRNIFHKYFEQKTRFLANKSKKIVVVSDSVKNDVVNCLKVPSSKIEVIRGGVNKNIFNNNHNHDVIFSNSLLFDSYCLYVGLGHKHKRLSWLLKATKSVLNKLPVNFKILIVGNKNNYPKDIFDSVQQLGLQKHIVFTDFLDDNKLAYLYRNSRAVIISSVDEGFCLPALEGACCGAEIIAPYIPVVRELLSDQCHYYEVNDQNQMACLIQKAAKGKLIKKNNIKYLENLYNWDHAANKMLKLIKSSML